MSKLMIFLMQFLRRFTRVTVQFVDDFQRFQGQCSESAEINMFHFLMLQACVDSLMSVRSGDGGFYIRLCNVTIVG
jgi:hypothetical protein